MNLERVRNRTKVLLAASAIGALTLGTAAPALAQTQASGESTTRSQARFGSNDGLFGGEGVLDLDLGGDTDRGGNDGLGGILNFGNDNGRDSDDGISVGVNLGDDEGVAADLQIGGESETSANTNTSAESDNLVDLNVSTGTDTSDFAREDRQTERGNEGLLERLLGSNDTDDSRSGSLLDF